MQALSWGDGSDAVLDFNVVRSGNAGSASGGAGLDNDEEMMPGTGFPMVEGIVTLPKQPETAVYAKTEYVLSIPKLDVKMPIVGRAEDDDRLGCDLVR